MPTYEHICENGHSFEEFQSIVAQPIEVCPVCGARAMRKISGGTGLIFKGSGFYITDYARKSGGKAATNASEKPSSSESPSAPPKTDSSGGKKDS